MALIYASAVNKRMNAPRKKRSLNSDNNCMETSYTSHCRQRSNEDKIVGHSTADRIVGHTNGAFDTPARERNQRKRSTSQNSGTNSSCNCTPPPTDGSTENLRSSMHQSIHRSKTTAADMHRKLTVVQINYSKPAMRKISSPISTMSQSVIYEPTFKQHSSMKNNLRKTLAKKRMGGKESNVYREELAQLAVSDSDHTEDEETPIVKHDTKHRRRSLSLDNSNDAEHKNGEKRVSSSSTTKPATAFRKMCDRFNRWKINNNAVQN